MTITTTDAAIRKWVADMLCGFQIEIGSPLPNDLADTRENHWAFNSALSHVAEQFDRGLVDEFGGRDIVSAIKRYEESAK